MKTMCMHEIMWRQMELSTQTLKAPGRMSLCCNVKFWYLNGGWFLIILELHLVQQVCHCQLRALYLWNPCWLTQSNLSQMVHAFLKVNWACSPVDPHSDSWLAMHHSNMTFELVYHCVHCSWQNFYILHVPDCCWWAIGSFCVGCSCTLPHLWGVPHTLVGLGRAAIPPHTCCSPMCSELCACPWRQWHRQGPCPLFPRTLPCCIGCNFTYGIALPSVGRGQPYVGPLNVVPPAFKCICWKWMWLLALGNSKGDVKWELRLSTVDQEVEAEAHSRVVGAVVPMCQHSNTAFPVDLHSRGNIH